MYIASTFLDYDFQRFFLPFPFFFFFFFFFVITRLGTLSPLSFLKSSS